MFNFRSLAAMIGEDEKGENAAHVENADSDTNPSPHSSSRKSMQMHASDDVAPRQHANDQADHDPKAASEDESSGGDISKNEAAVEMSETVSHV
jgi:hypothetical protein